MRSSKRCCMPSVVPCESWPGLIRTMSASYLEVSASNSATSVVFSRRVVEQHEVARAAGSDDGVGDRDRVDAVAIRALVGAAVLGAGHLELDDAQLVLGVRRRRTQRVVALAGAGGLRHARRRGRTRGGTATHGWFLCGGVCGARAPRCVAADGRAREVRRSSDGSSRTRHRGYEAGVACAWGETIEQGVRGGVGTWAGRLRDAGRGHDRAAPTRPLPLCAARVPLPPPSVATPPPRAAGSRARWWCAL